MNCQNLSEEMQNSGSLCSQFLLFCFLFSPNFMVVIQEVGCGKLPGEVGGICQFQDPRAELDNSQDLYVEHLACFHRHGWHIGRHHEEPATNDQFSLTSLLDLLPPSWVSQTRACFYFHSFPLVFPKFTLQSQIFSYSFISHFSNKLLATFLACLAQFFVQGIKDLGYLTWKPFLMELPECNRNGEHTGPPNLHIISRVNLNIRKCAYVGEEEGEEEESLIKEIHLNLN